MDTKYFLLKYLYLIEMIPKLLLPRNNVFISNEYKIIEHSFYDLYSIVLYYINPTKLQYIVRRLDKETGWDLCLQIQIKDSLNTNTNLSTYEIITFGHSDKNEIQGEYQLKNIKLEKKIYAEQKIPKNIVQTYYKNEYLSKSHYNAIHSFIDLNPEYTYYYFNDRDCRKFIQLYFDKRILLAYDKILPKALKSDIFRLCFIYINGGCYFDHKQILMKPIHTWIQPHDRQIYCDDEPELWMHNGIFCSVAQSKEIYDCLMKIVHFIENETFLHWADLTGPRIFYDYTSNYHRPLKVIKGSHFRDQCIIHKKTNDLLLYRCYFTYYNFERKECYDTLYRQKKLFYKDIQLVSSKYVIYRYPESYSIDVKTTHKKTKKSIQHFYQSSRSFALYPDRFEYHLLDDHHLQIRRVDSNEGWNFNLTLYRIDNITQEIKEYSIGSHPFNTKIIDF